MSARLLDALVLLLLVAAGSAFWKGANHIAAHEDLAALYWMAIGIFALRGSSQMARADRAGST